MNRRRYVNINKKSIRLLGWAMLGAASQAARRVDGVEAPADLKSVGRALGARRGTRGA